MTEAERQSRAYAEVKARLFGKPKSRNIIEEIRQQRIERERQELLEQCRRDEEKALRARVHQEKMRLYREEALRRKRLEELGKIRNITISGYAHASMTADYSVPVVIADFKCGKPTMERIALAVLERWPGVSLERVKSADRTRAVMLARREVIATIHRIRPDISYPMIGRFVEKDHTTCINAVRRYLE
jgi:hypothetical protein